MMPTITRGYMYSETIGKLNFPITLIGVNLVFPPHFLGLAGLPRRASIFRTAFSGWKYVSSVACVPAIGSVMFFAGLVYAFIRRDKAADNPRAAGAMTLEWTLSSPRAVPPKGAGVLAENAFATSN